MNGYWLYKEEFEKHHPKDGRMSSSHWRGKQITGEELQSVIRRAQEQYAQQRNEAIRTPNTTKNSSTVGQDNNLSSDSKPAD